MMRVEADRARKGALEILCVAAVLAPLVACLASGVLHASLWLDEIMYYYLENDPALRAAELGRSGHALAPYLGMFFHCDVQRALHALVRSFGLTVYRDPELYLRLSSLASYVVASLALYAFLRSRLERRWDAVLGALAFSSTQIFLHYAFEARVYVMTLMLVVLLVIATDAASRSASPLRLTAVVVLSLVTAHSHFWTLCLFAALLVVSALQVRRARRLTPWARSAAAAALPGLALIGVQVIYMKVTDPGAPVFPPFWRQEPLLTVWQLVMSNFLGVLQTQYLVHHEAETTVLVIAGGLVLLVLAFVSVRERTETPEGGRESDWAEVAVLSLFFCWVLAVSYGYYTQARYHVPLMGVFFFGLTRSVSRPKRLLIGLLVACNLGILPKTIEAIRVKASMKQVAELIGRRGGRDLSVVCQHVVSGRFPLPAQAIGLDFYLNVLHPDEPPIPIHELPDLALVNGRRGVYDLYAGGSPVVEHYLRSTPDHWRAMRPRLRPHLFVLDQAFNLEAGRRQSVDFAHVMQETGDRAVVGKYFVPGFPKTLLVEVRKVPVP